MTEVLSTDPGEWCETWIAMIDPTKDCKIAAHSDNDAVVLLRHEDGSVWLLAEVSTYQPMEFDIKIEDEDDNEPRFMTWGKQWFVNLNTQQVYYRDFEAYEGSIQGIVYAVYGLTGGGTLDPEDYKDYLKRLMSIREIALKPLEPADISSISQLLNA